MRYDPLDYDDANEKVRNIYSDYLRSTHSFELPNWLKSLGKSENLADGYWSFVKSTLVEGELPSILKEMVLFLVSVTNGSPYCATAHAHAVMALDKGLTFEDLVAMAENIDAVRMPEATKAALKFSVKLISSPHSLERDDFATLSRLGFSDAQIQELIATASLAQMFNTYAISLGLPIEEGYRSFPLEQAA
ncbi:MAG: carboxymuconolactone decarboxylase family protein [Hyphomicrobiaceae bacterium]